MSTPFDALAPTYAQQWSEAPKGRAQRDQVWRAIDGLFTPGSHVLDIGCGIGDDALHLMQQDIRVTGIDPSPAMAAIARHRGVNIAPAPAGIYDGALSNFGVFNCIDDWPQAALNLARHLPPGAPFALCVMPRFLLREPRRWRGQTRWRGITVYYRSRFETARHFAPFFALEQIVSIGRGDHMLFLFRRSQTRRTA